MNKEKFQISYPDERILKEQIHSIISAGLPVQHSFYSHLKTMYKNIGFKYIFYDFTEIIYILFSAVFIFLFTALNIKELLNNEAGSVYTLIFISSPLLFLAINFLSFIKSKQNNMLDIEMTCKYNFHQLAAFKMLIFSIICLAVNTLFLSVITAVYTQIHFLLAFVISSSSLFLFSALFLYFMMGIQSKLFHYLFSILWVAGNLILFIYSNEFYQSLLSNIPIYVYIIVIFTSIGFYLKNIKKLMTSKRSRLLC
ncbi:hypothetical protein [Metabacillus fastidiosus]|uniref:hypothetical protein n=1 Tax=Metabacillus fastidiosus TaxID=1458 RepID=UPI002E1D7E22|nr:hypothetical protein [Metabacillus fastidiosus]